MMMKSLSPLAQVYVDRFEDAAQTLPGFGTRSVDDLRKAGLDLFANTDFPTKRVEEWRFTNLAALTKGAANDGAPLSEPVSLGELALDHEIVFVDGIFSADESNLSNLPAGIQVTNLATTLGNGVVFSLPNEEKRALIALNTAYMQDGLCLHVDEDVKLDGLLGVTFKNTGNTDHGIHIRNRIILESGADITLVERHTGEGRYFSNPVTMISLGDGATLQHYKFQNESLDAYHVALTDCEIPDGAIYKNFSLTTGGKLSRNELKTSVLGADAESHLDGAYLVKGTQHCDTTTLTEHKVPQNISNQTYKGVLDGKAHGVFQGKIHISPDAQQVAGDQLSKALLLSEYAQVDCKPELEIYADDVKCSHGATSGELDEDALFYLKARGIPEAQAQKMLIEAFLADVLDSIDNEQVKSYFSEQSAQWLAEV
jgi:Fe-S cluster assembly protein SufD